MATAAWVGGLGAYRPAHLDPRPFAPRPLGGGDPLEIETSYRSPPAMTAFSLDLETRYAGAHAEPESGDRIRFTTLDIDSEYVADWTTGQADPASWNIPQMAPPADLHWRPAVALTFDVESPNGAEARRTLARVLDLLRAADLRATFFVVGHWAAANPDMLRQMVSDGHEIANHSLTHRCFANRPAAELYAELRKVEAIVFRETGTPVIPIFRPPYGCIDEEGVRVAEELGYQLAGWTASGQDASSHTHSALDVLSTMSRDLEPGGVALLHTSRWITADALPELLSLLADRHMEVVTVSEILRRYPANATRVANATMRRCGDNLTAQL